LVQELQVPAKDIDARTRRSKLRFPRRTSDFSSQKNPDWFWITFSACYVDTGNKAVRGMNLTSYLHLVPKLKMNGAAPLLPPHAFMERTLLFLYKHSRTCGWIQMLCGLHQFYIMLFECLRVFILLLLLLRVRRCLEQRRGIQHIVQKI